MPRKSYFENLDALRAFAAFSVILFHIVVWLNFPPTAGSTFIRNLLSQNENGGEMGVYFFFVLSGFLITYLMFLEKDTNKKFSIKHFYLRRVLRIWPLYFATLIIGFFIYPWIQSLLEIKTIHNSDFFMYAIFLANFDNMKPAIYDNGMLGVQWSVAIEEQFYLVWPLLFAISTKRYFVLIAIAILFFSLFFYSRNYTNWKVAYYHTIAQFIYLSFGAILAWTSFFYVSKVELFFQHVKKITTLLVYVIAMVIIFFQKDLFGIHPVITAGIRIFIMLFFGFVIMEQSYSNNSFVKFGRFKFLGWLGKISYGLYLLHMIAIYIVIHVFGNRSHLIVIEAIAVLAITILLSHLSYRYFESFFLGLKKRFSHL